MALVILGLVTLSYLQLFHQSHRLVDDSREWSQAIDYAEDAMERAKLEGAPAESPVESLAGGFRRQVAVQPWRPGLSVVQVTVSLPGDARLDLHRLLQTEPPLARGSSLETTDE